MKNLLMGIAIGIAALAATTSIAVASFGGTETYVGPSTPQEWLVAHPEAQTLTHEQQAWLGSLEWCESRGNPKAINPKDRDNTPSYGILQFKPTTFALFAKLYGTGSTTDFMNPTEQEAIVKQMILRGVNWAQQFPDCTKKLGTPPLSTTSASVRN